jgi:hypothetical protein
MARTSGSRRLLSVVAAAVLMAVVSCGSPGRERTPAGSSDGAVAPGGSATAGVTQTERGTTPPGGGRSTNGSVPNGKRRNLGVSWPGFGPSNAPTSPAPSSTPPQEGESSSLSDTPSTEDSSSAAETTLQDFSADWYGSLVHRQCEGIQDPAAQDGLAVLLRGLRAACPAVTSDGQAAWDIAEDAYDELASSGGAADDGCHAGIGYLLLQRLVTLHRTYPDANFHVAMDGSTDYGGC